MTRLPSHTADHGRVPLFSQPAPSCLRRRLNSLLPRDRISVAANARRVCGGIALALAMLGAAPAVYGLQVGLTWQDNSTNETGFKIERATGSGSYSLLATIAANTTNYSDTSVAAGGTYSYRVYAYNSAGSSGMSNVATLTTPAAGNTAPTITNLADRTIAVNSSTGAISFTVGDAQTSAGALVVSATSSNQTLVPAGNLVPGGTGSTRTLTATPVSSQGGSTTITVSVSDGTLTATDTFVLTVSGGGFATAIAGDGYRTTALTSLQSGAFSVTFNATPSTSNIDGLVALATSTPAGFSDLGVIVRFNPNGMLDARNGAAYASDASVPYAAGVTYHFRLQIDVPTHTFSAYVAPGSGAELLLAANYAFRTEQNAVANLGYWTVLVASAGANDTLTVGGFSIAAIAPANTAPTISNVTDQTISQDSATGALAFTIGDAETAAGSLTVSAASSNAALVSSTGLALGGSGANRTISVTPITGKTGTATVTVTVSDGTLTATDTFKVTVNPVAAVNTAPAISRPADQTIAQDTATGAITFTVGDVESSAGNLTVAGSSSNTTLLPSSGIRFGGTGANRTVALTPISGQHGSATVTLTVSDGSLTASTSFALTVTAPGILATPSVTITAPAAGAQIAAGSIVPITVSLSGDPSKIARVEFYDGSVKIGESTTAPYTLVWTVNTAGAHSLTAIAIYRDGSIGTAGSALAITVLPGSHLVNLSTRGLVKASEPMIAGFVLKGSGKQRVLLRAVGKSLENFGVTDVIEQPVISVVAPGSDTVVVQTSDGWDANGDPQSLINAMVKTGAFPLVTGSSDAAVLVDLNPGVYTAVINDNSRKGGICLVEAYAVEDGGTASNGTLMNLSTRGAVGRNSDVMIAGVVVSGTEPKRLLFRGIGPGLKPFGVSGSVADPQIEIYASGNTQTTVATNDNWDADATSAAEVTAAGNAVGAFALQPGSHDAALVIELAPGVYTVQLSAARGSTGTGLVEVYALD